MRITTKQIKLLAQIVEYLPDDAGHELLDASNSSYGDHERPDEVFLYTADFPRIFIVTENKWSKL